MPQRITSKDIATSLPLANLSTLPTSNPGSGKPWLQGRLMTVGAALDNSGAVLLRSELNQANGIPQLDSSGELIINRILNRVDTLSNILNTLLEAGELGICSDNNDIFIGDGLTNGGRFICSKPTPLIGDGTITTASTTAATVSFPVAKSGVYRIWGEWGFTGDTDSQSNARMTSFPSGVTNLGGTSYITNLQAIQHWAFSLSGTNIATTTTMHGISPSLPSAGTGGITCTPTDTAQQNGMCKFDMNVRLDTYSGTNYSATYNLRFQSRTTFIGTPTIGVSWRIFYQRIA